MPRRQRNQAFGSEALALVSLMVAALALLAAPFIAEAQPAAKVYRIGYVRAETPPPVDIEAFRQGLREHGYVEGTNVLIEYRWADGNEERLRSMVAELIRLKVDLIVASAPAATRVAKEATTTIPIVMVLVADPVAFGFVASLARPGGNVTGFAYLLPEISGKRLDLLKEAIPELSRVAVLWNAANPYKPFDLKEVQAVADALRVTVHTFPVREPKDLDDAFKATVKSRAGGLITLEDPFTIAHRTRIVGLALRHRLPAVYAVRPFVDAGGLMSYGPDRADQNRRASEDWSPGALRPYAEERAERMRRLRFCNALATTLRGEFGPKARERRRRARGLMQAEPELGLWRRAYMAGPESVPASAFDERVYERLCTSAVRVGA